MTESVICIYSGDINFIGQYMWGKARRCFNISIFWDITPCCPLKINRRFGLICRSIFRAEKIKLKGKVVPVLN
jgi:hypothetical protein